MVAGILLQLLVTDPNFVDLFGNSKLSLYEWAILVDFPVCPSRS